MPQSIARPIRWPPDLYDAAVDVAAQQGVGLSGLCKGSLLLTWQKPLIERLGLRRYQELLAEYHNGKEEAES